MSQKRICPGPGHGLVPSSGHLASGFNFHELNSVFIDELQEISGSFRHCFVVSCLVSLIGAVDWEKLVIGDRPFFKDGMALLSSALSLFLPEGDANVT